jgi:PAS domain S-box-containing protein
MTTGHAIAAAKRILIVEDETIVADGLRDQLQHLGHEVVGLADNGRMAVELAGRTRPDLVLMDLQLKGDLDGIQAADLIYREQNIPIVYVTADADEATLMRARGPARFGYVLKPVQARDLVMAIELATHRHAVERRLLDSQLAYASDNRQAEERFRRILDAAPDAMVVEAGDGRIVLVNSQTEALFGYTRAELLGQTGELLIPERLRARHPGLRRQYFAHPVPRPMGVGRELLGRRKDGTEFPIDVSLSPLDVGGERLVASSIRDITARIAEREQLRASEERFRSLVEHASDGIFISDASGRYLDVNSAACEKLGYSREEFLRLTIADVVDPEEVGRIGPEAARLGTGTPAKSEWRFIRKDGTAFVGEVHARQLADGRILAFLRDISARKEVEDALRRSQASLAEAQELAELGSWALDFRTNLLSWSDEVFRIFEIDRAGFIPDYQHFLACVHPADRERVNLAYTRSVATRLPYDIEHRLQLPAGRIKYVHERGRTDYDPAGAPVRSVGTVQDISARKHSEETQRQSEAKLRGLYELSPLGIALTDMQGRYLEFNEAFRRITGYAAEELKALDYWTLTPAEYAEDEQRQLECLRRAGHYGPYEKEYLRKDGSRVPLRLNGMLITNGDGQQYIWSIVEDVTDRRAAARALSRDRTRLETILRMASDGIYILDGNGLLVEANDAFLRMLGYGRDAIGRLRVEEWDAEHDWPTIRRQIEAVKGSADRVLLEGRHRRRDGTTIDVELSACGIEIEGQRFVYASSRDVTARKQAELERLSLEQHLQQAQKMEALGTLAGGIAHDFNNLLSVIMGNVELAADDVGGQHHARHSLQEIQNACRRARELVGQILTFSRSQPPTRVAVDLSAAVQESLTMLRPAVPADVDLVTHFGAGVSTISADPTQLNQVVINLCANAWQAMEGRPGRIEIRVEAIQVDAATAATSPDLHPGSYVRLQVADSGKGMDAATAARVFDPFFTTKRAGEGTGLGLAVVHGIVRAHDGAIVLETRPGAGATFKLYFPAVASAPLPLGATPAAGCRGAGQEIFCLDDEESLVKVTCRALRRFGYKATGFTRPEEGLEAFRAEPDRYAAAIVDFNMPGTSGLAVADQMLRLRPNLPFALATGFESQELRERAAGHGVRIVLHKPMTLAELLASVHAMLSGSAGAGPDVAAAGQAHAGDGDS